MAHGKKRRHLAQCLDFASAIEAVVLLQSGSRRTIVLKCEFKVLLPNIARYMPILKELFVNKCLLRIWYDKKV